ncbi:hypothetical protein D3C86_2079100 [compost metagenome]
MQRECPVYGDPLIPVLPSVPALRAFEQGGELACEGDFFVSGGDRRYLYFM